LASFLRFFDTGIDLVRGLDAVLARARCRNRRSQRCDQRVTGILFWCRSIVRARTGCQVRPSIHT
jgi:hypothetical protein